MDICNQPTSGLPLDFFYTVFRYADVPTLIQILKIDEYGVCAEFELQRRDIRVQPWIECASVGDLIDFFVRIEPFATRLIVDFVLDYYSKRHDYSFIRATNTFLDRCKTLTHVSLLNLPRGALTNFDCPLTCDFSTVRSLSLSVRHNDRNFGYHSESNITRMLSTCTANVLTELTLSNCVETGECLAAIPGQLHTLRLQNCLGMTFDYLYAYVRAYPELRELDLSQRILSDVLSLGELCPHLKSVRSLRIHRGTNWIDGLETLAELFDLQQLDVCCSGSEINEYIGRLTDKHQLERLRLEVMDITFYEENAAHLQNLPKLHSLELCPGEDVDGVLELLRALRPISGLRRVGLYPGQNFDVKVPMPSDVTAAAVQENLSQVEHLRVELPTKKLRKLGRMPQLRSLHLRIDSHWNQSERVRVNIRQANATHSFLRELSLSNQLQQLRLECKGDSLHLSEDIVRVHFQRFSRLKCLEVFMKKHQLKPFRETVGLVPVVRLVQIEKTDAEYWDGLWKDIRQSAY